MRIIGGAWRGRAFDAPPGKDTRPTAAVVREAIFGILGERIQEAQVLDLFCGSGAMSFEALSRGAKHAVLIDADAKAVAVARRNIQRLSATGCEVYRNDFLRAIEILARKGTRFDIVFIDPPYAAGYYRDALTSVFRHVARPGCLAVCEHDAKTSVSYDPMVCMPDGARRYGTRAITLFRELEQR